MVTESIYNPQDNRHSWVIEQVLLKFIFLTVFLAPLLETLEVRNRKSKTVLTVYIQYKLPSCKGIVNDYESDLLTEFINYSLTYIFRR